MPKNILRCWSWAAWSAWRSASRGRVLAAWRKARVEAGKRGAVGMRALLSWRWCICRAQGGESGRKREEKERGSDVRAIPRSRLFTSRKERTQTRVKTTLIQPLVYNTATP